MDRLFFKSLDQLLFNLVLLDFDLVNFLRFKVTPDSLALDTTLFLVVLHARLPLLELVF